MHEPAHNIQTAVILTALGLETKAVLRHLSDISSEAVSGTGFFRGRFEGWDVAVAEAGAGNVGAAAISARACEHYKPKVALFIGVAGGVKDVAVGDVVVATKVYGYESGKEKTSSFLSRPALLVGAHELEQRARIVRQIENWQMRLDPQLPHDSPSLHIGPIVAGEKVVASKYSPTARLIRELYGDALAVEMEGRGFLEGVHINHPVQGGVIRGISDLLSGKTNADQGGSQERAADAAAAVAFQMLSGLANDTGSPQGSFVPPSNSKLSAAPSESDLKAMAVSLLDAGKPPSMTMLFPDATPAIRATLAAASKIERTIVEAGPSNKVLFRTGIAQLVSTEHRRHLILGPPGSGKTHTLWHVAEHLLNDGNVIPMYLPAGQIDRWDDLAAILYQAAPTLKLEEIVRDPRVCFLIDGWSEYASGEHAGEKQKTFRALQNTRIIASGKILDVSDTPFKTWELEPLTQQQVTDILTAAHPGQPLPPTPVIDLLRLPLLLAIQVHLPCAGAATGELLRQFHEHIARDLPEGFTVVLAEAVAASEVCGDRAYGGFVANLQSKAAIKGISEPTRLLRRLGSIVERNGQAVPIHDLYWSWLSGRGLLTQSVATAIDQLQTRECYRLALQSGARPMEADVEAAASDDVVLAAVLDVGLRRNHSASTLIAVLKGCLSDTRLAVCNRGALAVLESGSSVYLKDALQVLTALSSAKLYVPDWPQALRPEILYKQRAILADWIGSKGSELILDAIAERGGPEWVPWLEQVASEGKITYITALSAALGCDSCIPSWGWRHLDDLFRTSPWRLRAAAARGCNQALARHIAAEYERLVLTIIPQNSSGWVNLNQTLVSCGDDAVFNHLLSRFNVMNGRAQELLGYAIVDRGQPWLAAFQRIAFGKPSGDQHHKLAEVLSPQIDDETARAWINAGHYKVGWRVLIAHHGAAVLPELIAELPANFAGVHDIPSLAVMDFLENAPTTLIDELLKRLGSPMQPKAAQDVFNAIAKVYPTGVPAIVNIVSQQLNNVPAYHCAQILQLYRTWRQKTGAELIIQLPIGESLEFDRWIVVHRALNQWEEHFTPRLISQIPDLAINVVLNKLNGDVKKSASVLTELKDIRSYDADLFEYMLAIPELAKLIPDVFASVFDTFPVSALHRCIESSHIDQNSLLFRLGATSNPLHRSVHAQLINRILIAPLNLHHCRYVANMLRGHVVEDTISLLINAVGVGGDNWLWLVREVEVARGVRLINEAGEFRPNYRAAQVS